LEKRFICYKLNSLTLRDRVEQVKKNIRLKKSGS